jgi:hypothetical protein
MLCHITIPIYSRLSQEIVCKHVSGSYSHTNTIHQFDHPNRFWHSDRISILGTKYLDIQTEISVLISMLISHDVDITPNAMPSLSIQTSRQNLCDWGLLWYPQINITHPFPSIQWFISFYTGVKSPTNRNSTGDPAITRLQKRPGPIEAIVASSRSWMVCRHLLKKKRLNLRYGQGLLNLRFSKPWRWDKVQISQRSG